MGAVLFSRLGPRWLTFLAGSRELTTQRNSGSNPKVFHLSEKRDCSLSGPQLKKKKHHSCVCMKVTAHHPVIERVSSKLRLLPVRLA